MDNDENASHLNEIEILKQAALFVSSGETELALKFLLEAQKSQPSSEKIVRELTYLYKITNNQIYIVEKHEDSLGNIDVITPLSDDDFSFLNEKFLELKEDEYKFNIENTLKYKIPKDALFIKTDQLKSQKPFISVLNKKETSTHFVNFKLNHETTDQLIEKQINNELNSVSINSQSNYTYVPNISEPIVDKTQNHSITHSETECLYGIDFNLKESIIDNTDYNNDNLEYYKDSVDDNLSFAENDIDLYSLWDDDISYDIDHFDSAKGVLDNNLTHEERARFVAVECILEFDWDTDKLPFLIEVFSSVGWSNSRNALRREVNSGATFEELQIAYDVKNHWQESSKYWIAFSKTWISGESADAIYKHCTWKQALRLIRLFDGIPTFEEVYDFLENEFENWYQSNSLREYFSAFNKYLFSYKLSNKSIFIIPHELDLHIENDKLDADWTNYNMSDEMMLLKELGIDLYNKYSQKSYFASDSFSDEHLIELYCNNEKTQQEGIDE